eukprot:jgi/Psemu1/303897/fgenesh1_kg.127_\
MGRCFCGGALIAPDLVLSAAHCFHRPCSSKQVPVYVGAWELGKLTWGAQARIIEKVITHPLYSDIDYNHDYAVGLLDTPVTIDESRIKLELNQEDNFPSDGTELIAMGFGTLSENSMKASKFLRNVTLPSISNEKCSKYYKGQEEINNETICTIVQGGGKDVCFGDSGAPLVERSYKDDGIFVDTHVGIVSWGYGCAKARRPGAYARTSNQIEWIKATACDDLKSVAAFCQPTTSPSPTTIGTPTEAPTEQRRSKKSKKSKKSTDPKKQFKKNSKKSAKRA